MNFGHHSYFLTECLKGGYHAIPKVILWTDFGAEYNDENKFVYLKVM